MIKYIVGHGGIGSIDRLARDAAEEGVAAHMQLARSQRAMVPRPLHAQCFQHRKNKLNLTYSQISCSTNRLVPPSTGLQLFALKLFACYSIPHDSTKVSESRNDY